MEIGKKKPSTFMKVLKYIALGGTAISAITGAILGVNTIFVTFKAKAGYEEHSKIIEKYAEVAERNREEIRFLYRTLLATAIIAPKPNADQDGSSRPRHRGGRASPQPSPPTTAAPKESPNDLIQEKLKELPQPAPRHRLKKWDDLDQQKK